MKYEIDFEGYSDDIKREVFKVALERGNHWYADRSDALRLTYRYLRIYSDDGGLALSGTKAPEAWPKITPEAFIAKFGTPTVDETPPHDFRGGEIRTTKFTLAPGVFAKNFTLRINGQAVKIKPGPFRFTEGFSPKENLIQTCASEAHRHLSYSVRVLRPLGVGPRLNLLKSLAPSITKGRRSVYGLNLDAPAVTSIADYGFPVRL